jgi:putative protease
MITNLKNDTVYLEKSEGNYQRIFNEANFLNVDIVTDLPGLFSGFMIDLRNVKTATQTDIDKSEIIRHFENLLTGNPGSKNELLRMIHPTTNTQYKRGI